MQIPIWCLILAIIALFIVLLLSAKIKLVISYANEASVYVKFLFFKINLVPSAPKPKKKKTRKKKKKKSHSQSSSHTAKVEKKKLSVKQIIKIISIMKDTITGILKDFLGKIHFRFIKIYADIGCEDASKTALAYGAVSQSVAYFVELLDNISNVEVSKSSSIDIRSNFISQKSVFELNCLLYLRVASLFSLGLKSIVAYFKYKNLQEQLLEVENNGTIQAK